MKLPELKVGDLPEVDAFYPTDLSKALSLLPVAVTTLAASTQITPNPLLQIAAVPAALAAAWFYDRHATRSQRDGYLLEKPFTFGSSVKIDSNTNWDVTELLRKRTELKEVIVTETHTHQYRILHIPNLDPEKIKKQLPAISMKLGIDENLLVWIQNFAPGKSAILVPVEDEKQWTPVPFKPEALTQGRLQEYIGESITKDDVILDRSIYPHVLVTGITGSGKTEAFCASVASMQASGMNPIIVVIDPKNTPQLKRLNADFYTSNIAQGIEKMENILAEAELRMDKYGKFGCDNFFEYYAKDQTEQPICVYWDEVGKSLRQDPMEQLEEGEIPRHKRAQYVLITGLEIVRSAGVCVTAALQVGKATNIPTDARDNFGARIIFSAADDNAARTSGTVGSITAAQLQPQGGFILKTGRKTVMGRGAYLKTT